MMYEIPSDIEQLMNAQMASGKYHSPDDLLRDALQTLALQPTAEPTAEGLSSQSQSNGSVLDALERRGLVGCIRSGHSDLSSNPAHMKGFGENGNSSRSG